MKYIKAKYECVHCGHIERGSWRDELIRFIQAFFVVGGFFFWLVVIVIIANPQLAGQMGNAIASFMLNNIAGYQTDPYLRDIAVKEVEGCYGDDECQVRRLVSYVYNEVQYVPDTVTELYRSPREVLESGWADCSGFATAFAALARQVGMPARVTIEKISGKVHHAYVVVEDGYGTVYEVEPTAGAYQVVE